MDTSMPITRRLAFGLTPLALAAGPVVGVCLALNEPQAAIFASLAVVASVLIGATGELVASSVASGAPLLRMLVGMGVRGMSAAFLLLLAMATSRLSPATIVCVALPLYMSLIAGEVWLAVASRGSEPAALPVDLNKGTC